MECLQYVEYSIGTEGIMDVLNLVINGMPSIQCIHSRH